MIKNTDLLRDNSRPWGGFKDSDFPLTSCRFGIEIDNTIVGIFQCSSLQTEIEAYSYQEGGE